MRVSLLLLAALPPHFVLPQAPVLSAWLALSNYAIHYGYASAPNTHILSDSVPKVVDLLTASTSVAVEPTSTDLSASIAMAASPAQGLHTDLLVTIKITSLAPDACTTVTPTDLLLVFALPPGAYVDEHELEARHPFADTKNNNRPLASRVNVHTYRANRFNTFVLPGRPPVSHAYETLLHSPSSHFYSTASMQ